MFPGLPDGRTKPGSRFSSRMTGSQARAWSAGLEVVYGLIGMGLVGFGIDYFAGTAPVWMLILGGVGLLWGFYRFIKDALAINSESSKSMRGLKPLPPEPGLKADNDRDAIDDRR